MDTLKYLRECLKDVTYIRSFIGIYFSFWQRTAMSGFFTTCRQKKEWNSSLYSNLVDYFKACDDPKFCVKIVNALPKQFTEVWFAERQKYKYEIPLG